MTDTKPGRRAKPKMNMTAVPVKDATDEQRAQAAHAYDLLVKSIYRRLQHDTNAYTNSPRSVDSSHTQR